MRSIALLLLAAGAWLWPVPPGAVERPFDPPAHAYGAGHRGVDLAASPGDAVLAPADGVVRFAGMVAGRPVVSIDHGDGLVSSFEPVEPAVAEGEAVARGDRIGTLLSGHGDGSALHLGARLGGAYVDPLPLLGRERPVLLPLGPERKRAVGGSRASPAGARGDAVRATPWGAPSGTPP